MRCSRLLSRAAAAGLLLAVVAASSDGQNPVPKVSARTYTGGSAKVTVTGQFQVDQDVPINTKASLSDGEMTWLQYGVSGAEEPNALITVSESEIGVSVGRGKRVVTAGAENCKGKLDVTAALVSGSYTCAGLTSYDAATKTMGKVNIEVRFTAK